MASFHIEKRPRSDGSVRYRCKVVVKANNKIIHRSSKTFSKHAHAKTWGKRMLDEIELNGLPGYTKETPTLGELIQAYLTDPNLSQKIGRTKKYVLEMVVDCDIASIKADELTTQDFIAHCRFRAAANTAPKPATIYHDVTYIKSVLKVAKPLWGYDVTYQVVEDVLPTLFKLGLVARSERRTRRQTPEEELLISEGLAEREATAKRLGARVKNPIPFNDIYQFSLLTCMRLSEVTSITWEDLEQDKRLVMIRNRKDPRKKAGNHMWCPLLGDSFDIVMRQTKVPGDNRIFPFNSKSVAAGFQRVRNKLGIKGLQYRDLRREGASRLFELGYSIEEVAQVTGHRDLNVLWNIYTQLQAHRIHDKKTR
ncbi:tyrosine-type recombinase/integrase [Paraferrimonas haliotis]|uniref:Integrase n=1 Tax=Paraferrimonas haliotis TaxID=2013866 RepID=A0AA37TKM0_9GAMM|nr:tyrosine-type recombinase/integrase [Paraferrimonas haliotis]GLS83212.1 integrase [Paraferrimonas haliotis]